jgi:tRNA-dihydrouridine synthase A
MVGLFHGRPGARQWRRHLSEKAVLPGANGDVLRQGLSLIEDAGALAA